LRSIETLAPAERPVLSLLHDLAAPLASADEADRRFVLSRAVGSGIGLAVLTALTAWRGAASGWDLLLTAGMLASLLAAYLMARGAGRELAYTVASTGVACLVICVLRSGQALAVPASLFLLATPLEAHLAGRRRAALWAALASAAAALLLLGVPVASMPPASVSGFASAFLVGAMMIEIGTRSAGVVAPPPPSERVVQNESLLSAIGDLVTWHDRHGDVLRAAGAACRVTGRHPDALARGGLFAQVHIPDRPTYLKALSDAAVGSEPVSVEFRLQVEVPGPGDRTSSRLVWVEMRALAVPGLGGGPGEVAVVAFTRDATAVHEHAAELDGARLEAVRASEMKGRFLATVSHELRTPLNAIIGFSELLSADHPYVMAEDRRKEYATIIRNSGHHLLEVVNTLLDMSKIESGNFTLAPEPFSMAELATGCCDLMRLKADESRIRLVSRVAPDLPDMVGDRRACRQILINLLSNAVKFTPAEGAVTVAMHRDGDRMVLAVSDTGIGIRETDLPRLGDPFFQAGDLHRRPHEGTGLGLSVVRGLVGLHRGTMSIESGPGLGTTVTVALPLNCREDDEQAPPVLVATSARRQPVSRSDRRIA
jgi:cell cycle sensor histidine kinase DivJ